MVFPRRGATGGLVKEKIIDRVLRRAGVPDLLEVLAGRLSRPELQSLLLEVARRRAREVTPARLLQHYERDQSVRPSPVDPRRMLELDRLAFTLLPPAFEPIELSPVCPLGTASAVAPINQDKAVATMRNTEVCSDSTNVMALECARRRLEARRAAAPEAETRLCTSHRLLRPHVPAGPAAFPHFRIFTMCTAGRDRGSFGFEVAALVEHADFYLRLLEGARGCGYVVGRVRVSVKALDASRAEALERDVLEELGHRHPDVEIELEHGEVPGYYEAARLQVFARDGAGRDYFLVDGGMTDWTRRLLSDRKERLMISGLGSERLVACFAPAGS
jgi:hypothetical protein